MSTSQEKLEDAAIDFCDAQGSPCSSVDPDGVHKLMVGFARERLEKAVEIADKYHVRAAEEIRKLLE